MFLAPVDIHGCILFNFIVIIKIATNDSHLWSCVCCYQSLALCNKRFLQSDHICKFGKFLSVCNLCNLDSQITPSTEDFQLQQTLGVLIYRTYAKIFLIAKQTKYVSVDDHDW